MKQISLVLITVLSLVMVAKAQPKGVVADKIVAVVGDKIILKSDIENSIIDMQRQNVEIPENAACLVLEQAMAIKALVLQAQKDSLPVTDEEVDADIDNRIRSFIMQYGTKDELERIAGKSVYQLKEDFKEPIRDQMLSRAMRNKIVEDIRITPNEVKKFYSKIPKDSLFLYESEVEVSQIVLFPKASREAEEYCIQQLKDYKQQVESGKKDFKTLASNYTMDPGSKENGGQYEINRSQKDLDPIWLSKAFTLKDGQVSNPFKTRFGYHILQLVSRAGDDAVVRHILLIPQVTSIELKSTTEKLDSIRKLLVDGNLTFGEAVSRFSDDEASKFNAGQLSSARDGSTYLTIDQLDKDMVVMMESLKVGEYSQPTAFTDDRGRKGLRIVYLKSKTEPHRENLKDDYNRVAQRALEEKKNEALEKWFNSKIPTYFIQVDEEYRSCEEMKKWVSNAGRN
ncbi:MAG: peptidylprolyl isomerase [Chitinophagaceae bacterium]|nr:peptidylprolyl isomerase [Chitinophagaceae bacterium]MBL0055157.1 peptidylprolyl isomerase [Chitinophagaceae bacterium]